MKEEEKNRNGKSRGKKKTGPVTLVLILVLLLVMGYSGYQILSQLLHYKQGQDSYKNLRNEVIRTEEVPPYATLATPAWTVPAVEPTAPEAQAVTLPGETEEETGPDGSRASRTPHGSPLSPSEETDEMRGDITYDPAETFSSEPQVLPWYDIDFARLKSINPDTVGWLYGMDGVVNYPVVQGSDNEYYSHRLLDGTEQFCGTLFADARNNYLQDDITYIYGHKMKDGSMFGHFGRYDTYDYYRTHPTFRLFTPDGIYELQVITCVYTTEKEPLRFNFSDAAEFSRTINNYLDRGQFRTAVDVQYGDKLVCLWTCAYYTEGGRMFVICKAVRVTG